MSTGSRPPQPKPTVSWPGPRPILWAPHARTVDVVVRRPVPGRASLRLVGAHKPGYWGADHELAYGTEFGFSIDGGEPVADPTGTFFPAGLHGLSRVLEPPSGWTDHTWRPPTTDVVALLHLDIANVTTAGTFDAAIPLLPRIARSGIQGVELAPIAAYGDGGPAAGVRLFAVHEPLGGIHGLARFVDAAHAHGLAVVLTPPHRWAVAPALGLEVFGPYAADGRLNLAGGGGRGVRDLISADAERWFVEFRVDGLALDAEALTDRSSVPFVAELANETLAVSAQLERSLTLYVDGPGRSDRLTGVVRRLLALDGPLDSAAVEDVRHLAVTMAPAARLSLRGDHGWVRRPRPAALRAASLVVGNITRLPAARRAMPWATPDERSDPGDLDSRATMLAVAMLAGTPLVLDTDHVPVGEDSPDADRLLSWCAELAPTRADTIADLSLRLDVRSHDTALVVRRGSNAIAFACGSEEARVPLADVLPGEPSTWQLRAAWSPAASILAGHLVLPGRTAAVLRARA